MNTNSNLYTVIYTSVVCVLVAAILAFVSQALAPRQEANEKAETISQILTAARFADKSEWDSKGNDAILSFYKENVEKAWLVNAQGEENGTLDISKAEIVTVAGLKKQNYAIKDGSELSLPVYRFKNGITVVPIYGAGLWGPVWGYIKTSRPSRAPISTTKARPRAWAERSRTILPSAPSLPATSRISTAPTARSLPSSKAAPPKIKREKMSRTTRLTPSLAPR